MDLDFDQLVHIPVAQKLVNDLVVLMRVLGPVDGNAVGLGAALEHFKIMRKVGECVLLDLRGQITQLLPFGYAPGRLVAPGSQYPQQLIQVLLVSSVVDKLGRVLCLFYDVHWVTPFNICAT
jgi:hypothetical protein